MSVTIKLQTEGNVKSGYELEVDEKSTVQELVEMICKREHCDEEQVEILMRSDSVGREISIAELGAAFLADPLLTYKIWPRIKFGFSLSISALTQRFGSQETLDSQSSLSRFPLGSWVETKIKESILVSEESKEWCMGKVLEDTGDGYLIEVFENYKFLMPAKIKAADADVRMPRQQSLTVVRQKSNDANEDEFKNTPMGERGRARTRSRGPRRSLVNLSQSQDSQRKSYKHLPRKSFGNKRGSFQGKRGSFQGKRGSFQHLPRRGSRSSSAEPLKLKSSKIEICHSNNPGKRNRCMTLTTPSRTPIRNRSSSNPRGRTLSTSSSEYRAKVREYTAKFPNLRGNEIKSYIRVFRTELDGLKRGVITKNELSKWMKDNGLEVDQSTTNQLLASLDLNDGSDIDLGDFIAIMSSNRKLNKSRPEEKELFESFDLDGDGVISLAELRVGMRNILGKDLSEHKLTRMIREADSTGTGSICFKDFIKMMKK